MKVEMQTIAAGPERILYPGKVYDLPKDVAETLLTPHPETQQVFAKRADRNARATKLPPQPDPQDNPTVAEDDEGWATEEDS